MRRTLLLSALVVAGCSGNDPRRDVLGFYERLDFLRAKYDAALDSRDYTEQARIEVSIVREAQRRYDQLVRECAEDPVVRHRVLATFALGFSKRVEAGPVLRARLDDADPEVRVIAAVGLGQLKVPDPPIDRIKQMLDEPEPYVRRGALFALKLMLAPGNDGGLGPRLVGLLDDVDWSLRNEAVLVLREVRKAEFLEPLASKGFKDAMWLVRYNAALAVGMYGAAADAYIPHLIELLRDLEAAVVEAAHWAIKRVTGKDFDRSYHSWRDWYDDEKSKYEYYCVTHPEIVRPVAGACPTCQARLEKRLKPNVPKRDENK